MVQANERIDEIDDSIVSKQDIVAMIANVCYGHDAIAEEIGIDRIEPARGDMYRPAAFATSIKWRTLSRGRQSASPLD